MPDHNGILLQSIPPGGFPELELSLELQQQGWKKFWSKRENRPYFWNKLTGESLWVVPSLKPQVLKITNNKRTLLKRDKI